MHPYTYNFSFRIRHPNKDLKEISKVFGSIQGFTLKRVWKVGDPGKTPKGDSLEGNYPDSYCYFQIFDEPQSSDKKTLAEALEGAVNELKPHKKTLDELDKDGAEVNFFIGWYFDANSGETLNPDLLKKLADLNIGLEFDLYPPGLNGNET
jgi:hypothetical protein